MTVRHVESLENAADVLWLRECDGSVRSVARYLDPEEVAEVPEIRDFEPICEHLLHATDEVG